jgi:hypothetical protein
VTGLPTNRFTWIIRVKPGIRCDRALPLGQRFCTEKNSQASPEVKGEVDYLPDTYRDRQLHSERGHPILFLSREKTVLKEK